MNVEYNNKGQVAVVTLCWPLTIASYIIGWPIGGCYGLTIWLSDHCRKARGKPPRDM